MGKNLLHSKMTQLRFVGSLGGVAAVVVVEVGGGCLSHSLCLALRVSIGGESADDNVDPLLLLLLLRNEGAQQGTETAN